MKLKNTGTIYNLKSLTLLAVLDEQRQTIKGCFSQLNPKGQSLLYSHMNPTGPFEFWKKLHFLISNKSGAFIKWFSFWAQFALLLPSPVLPISDAKSHSKALQFQFPEMGSLRLDDFFRLLFNLVSSAVVSFYQKLAISLGIICNQMGIIFWGP